MELICHSLPRSEGEEKGNPPAAGADKQAEPQDIQPDAFGGKHGEWLRNVGFLQTRSAMGW